MTSGKLLRKRRKKVVTANFSQNKEALIQLNRSILGAGYPLGFSYDISSLTHLMAAAAL